MSELEVGKARINFHIRDKIGLPNYSNVEYGLSITRDVPDEGTAADLKPYIDELVKEVEDFVAEERSKVLSALQGEANNAK